VVRNPARQGAVRLRCCTSMVCVNGGLRRFVDSREREQVKLAFYRPQLIVPNEVSHTPNIYFAQLTGLSSPWSLGDLLG
jgi:hypothetical protein